jgi:L-ascorbate metabolism protein UlaG (beta-lactamase superfamily)
MRVTVLGHAAVLVELHGRAVLIDPVFQDPFAEGAIVSCPARRVRPERLPKIDLVVISDASPDRVDIATLAQLSRDCAVICPRDPPILYILEKLGFKKARPTEPGDLVHFERRFDLVTTPSTRKGAEFGVLLKDASGTFWHPVATGLARPIVERVRRQMGPVALFLAQYAVQDFSYVGIQRAGFPGQFLRASVACAQDLAPALVVPGSAGFRFTEPFEWTNAFLFPISRDRFLAELARAAPGQRSAIGNPGDVFEVAKGAVERRPGASAIATMIEDDTDRIAFDPTAPVPPLTDPNCDGYPIDRMEQQVTESFDELTQFVRASYSSDDPVVAEHRRVRGSYGLGVVFPDGRERWLRIAFGQDGPTVESGDGPIRGALNTHRIAASVLTARARYERSYHFMGGLGRVTVISPAQLVDGQVAVEPRQPPDLLLHWIRIKPPGWNHHWKQMLDFRLAPFVSKRSRR